ncbi:MAG: hypothetical protein ABJG78_13375 [Cyclobacteriaceae bacterium]
MVQYATNQLGFLEEDLDAFIAFDSDLGAAKRDAMIALRDWALNEGGDEMNVSKLGDRTEIVLGELENSRRLYNQIRYWVAKTFPKRKAIQRQFGIGRFTKIADSQEAMIAFMIGLSQSVAEYRSELEGSGAPAAVLDSVEPQAEALQAANIAQEKKKGNRTVDTEERISQLNQLHQHAKEYNVAAEFVFYDSPAMRDRYRPPSKISVADEEIEGDGF